MKTMHMFLYLCKSLERCDANWQFLVVLIFNHFSSACHAGVNTTVLPHFPPDARRLWSLNSVMITGFVTM